MGALAFAGRKFLGIALVGAGMFFGVVFFFMDGMRPQYHPWGGIIGIITMLAGVIFGFYYWRVADRHI